MELAILFYLKQQENLDPMSKHVIALLNHFEHQRPNGKHICIITEALSASVSNFLKTCLKYSHGLWTFFLKLIVKRILRQVLMGICFLYSYGIIHGDLHLGNILFSAPSPHLYIAKKLEHNETIDDFVLTRPNATLDKSASWYIAVTLLLIEHFCNIHNHTVKIIDLVKDKFIPNTNTVTRLTLI